MTDLVTNTLISLKQPGEEYTEIKSKLQSTVMGKEEVQDISRLTVMDEDHKYAGFEFPSLNNEAMTDIFGNVSEIGVQVIH